MGQGELIHLRRLAYISEKRLSAEVSARMHLEEMNKKMEREVNELRLSKESSELQLREESKRQWHEGQKAKVRCASLERLLAEAYELINMVELQHHLQVKSLMPALYGDPRPRRETLDEDESPLQGLEQRHQQQQQQLQRHLENGDGNPSRTTERGNRETTAKTSQARDTAASQTEDASIAVKLSKALSRAGPLVAV